MATPVISTPGTSDANIGSAAPGIPASVAAGNLLLLRVCGKYPTNYPTTPTGWTFIGVERCNANTAASADNGDVYMWAAYKIADGTESGTVAVTASGGDVTLAIIDRITVTSGKVPSIAVATAHQDTETTANVTLNFTPDLDWQVDDKAVVLYAGNTDSGGYGNSAPGISVSGITFNANTEQASVNSAVGDDVKMELHYKTATAGSGTAAGATTFSVGGIATATAALFLRIREIDPPSRGGVWDGVWRGVWRGVW